MNENTLAWCAGHLNGQLCHLRDDCRRYIAFRQYLARASNMEPTHKVVPPALGEDCYLYEPLCMAGDAPPVNHLVERMDRLEEKFARLIDHLDERLHKLETTVMADIDLDRELMRRAL